MLACRLQHARQNRCLIQASDWVQCHPQRLGRAWDFQQYYDVFAVLYISFPLTHDLPKTPFFTREPFTVRGCRSKKKKKKIVAFNFLKHP